MIMYSSRMRSKVGLQGSAGTTTMPCNMVMRAATRQKLSWETSA